MFIFIFSLIAAYILHQLTTPYCEGYISLSHSLYILRRNGEDAQAL